MTETATPALPPGESPGNPYTPRDAQADLRRLGQLLDQQARGGASSAELDVTLRSMRTAHERIIGEQTRRYRK